MIKQGIVHIEVHPKSNRFISTVPFGVCLLVHIKVKLLVLIFVSTNYNKNTQCTWIPGENNILVGTQYTERTTTTETTITMTITVIK